MTALEARLLDCVQEDFPVDPRPYEVLARAVHTDEATVLASLGRLRESGLLRDAVPVFDAGKLGYVTTLACTRVPEERIEEVASLLRTMPEVTHNYLRDHEWNMWFALVAPGQESLESVLSQIARETGCDPVHNLPQLRQFKLRAVFRVSEGSAPRPLSNRPRQGSPLSLDSADWDVIEALQEGIPLDPRPYALLATRAAMTEAEFLGRLARLVETGCVRRMGLRVRHHEAGVKGNIMVVWNTPEERVEEVGMALASAEAVSHCYLRPTFEGFPYNLYSMVHAPTMDAAERLVQDLARRVGIADYQMLRSLRELKKSSPVYRRPER